MNLSVSKIKLWRKIVLQTTFQNKIYLSYQTETMSILQMGQGIQDKGYITLQGNISPEKPHKLYVSKAIL